MFKLSRMRQFVRRAQFEGAYEAALKSDNIYERVGTAKFALEIVDKLDPWPDSVGPRERAIGKLHAVLGHDYNELGETYPQRYSSLALEESMKAVTYLTKSDGVDWARAMIALSLAHANSLEGNRFDNIERAIEAAEAALEILERDLHREEWLNATVNLAAYYASHRRDSLTTNIEKAIRLYKAVYKEIETSGSPLRRARALIGLGDALIQRRTYSKEKNIDEAIEVLEKALTIISPETAPRAWSNGQQTLAMAYMDRISGERSENLHHALEANERSIAVLEELGDARERWARAKVLRSALLEECQDGNRAQSLREAIDAAKCALTVFSQEESPDDYFEVVHTINRLQSLQHDGNRSEVMEEIIRKHEVMLPSESDPGERAISLIRLGNAYAERVQGDRSENMERSIECLEEAVDLSDQHARPFSWGSAMLSLAQSYHERAKGLHADNIERSIALCENALVVISSLSDPDQHSAILETLAEGFFDRVRGDRRENLKKAIEIYNTAHQRRNRNHNPEAWLRLEQKYLQAERVLYSLTAPESENDTNPQLDPEQYLEGLRASANLVSVKDHPRTWMAAHLFLADTYTQVTPSGIDINDAIPFVDAFCANCREAVSIYESLLPVADRLGDKDQRALLHQRIGVAYGLMHVFTDVERDASAKDPELQNRLAQQTRSYFKSAVAAHEAALEIYSLERSPRAHLKSAVTLGRLHAYEREWAASEEGFASAARAADKMLGDIELSESDMKDVLGYLSEMATFAPFVSLMLDKPTRAIELFESGRARLLAKALTLESLPLLPKRRDDLHAKQRELAIHEKRLLSPRLFDRLTPLEESIRLRRQIKTLVQETSLADHFSGFTLSALEALVADGSVVVIPMLSEMGGRIVICFGRNGKSETRVVECPGVEALRSIFESRGGWQQQYREHSKFGMPEEILCKVGDALGEVFATPLVQALESLGIIPGTHLDILPQGPLGVLPLGLARDDRSGQLLIDRYEISLSPSLTSLYHAKKRAAIVPASVVTLGNPTGDLRYAKSESHLLRNWFPDKCVEFKEGEVSPEEVLAALPQGEVWHFATHGLFEMSVPLQSCLQLGKDKNLTLEMIFEARGLGTPRLVVLSACESGLYDLTSFPSEFIGLPNGFLHAGAAGVIATLWPVDDLSTALIMGRFYEGYMGGNLKPSAALRAAQLWLRDATAADLVQTLMRWRESGRVSSIGTMIDVLLEQESSQCPFSAPVWWGGFVHYGV